MTPCTSVGCHVLCASPDCTCDCHDYTGGDPS